jgi:hypothetical protein
MWGGSVKTRPDNQTNHFDLNTHTLTRGAVEGRAAVCALERRDAGKAYGEISNVPQNNHGLRHKQAVGRSRLT